MACSVRRRLWAQAWLAVTAAGLAGMTVVNPEWIEAVFGVDPDHGDGTLEWLIVAGLSVVAVVAGVFARIEWRRPAPSSET